MVPLKNVLGKIIKPGGLCLCEDEAKNCFITHLNDEDSYKFMQYLVIYCIKDNNGEWPEKITNEILQTMSKNFNCDFVVEKLKLFQDGHIIKNGLDYELTHEFITSLYLCCSNHNFVQLKKNHIDLNKQEKIKKFLQDNVLIKDQQVIKFSLKLLSYVVSLPGVLLNRRIDLSDLKRITGKNNLNLEHCFSSAKEHNLIIEHSGGIVADGLIFCSFIASPKLVN